MATSVNQSLIATPSRVGFRLRRDISWHSHKQSHSNELVWIAEDPLTRKLFRCGNEEFRILEWLDSESTLESLRERFLSEFAPQTIELQQLRGLVAKCNQSGMLRPTINLNRVPTSSVTKWRYPKGSVSRTLLKAPLHSNELHWFLFLVRRLAVIVGRLTQVQVSLGAPDRILNALAPKLAWLYSVPAVRFWLGLFCVAGCLITMQWERLWSELPSLQSLRSPALLVGFGVIFVLTRFIHELGHAVVCKRVGACCKDAGFLVSFGMLCPYVDITDAWKIGSKHYRIGIALAGIYTECVLASAAAMIWLCTHPGWIHEAALQTLLVCTATTIVFNANPLMKYDGYFVLCDLLNTQNLREKSFESLDSMLDGRPRKNSTAMSIFLALYFLASTLNRLVLLSGLVSMVYYLASQWQLRGLGIGFILLYGSCATISTMAAWTFNQVVVDGVRKLSRRAVILGWTAVSFLIAWAVNIPLPSRTFSYGTIHLGDRQGVYATLPGQIERTLTTTNGAPVESDATILKLINTSIQKSSFELESRLKRLETQLETYQRNAFFDQRLLDSIPSLLAQRDIVAKQLSQKQEEASRLNVRALASGWFEPVVAHPPEVVTSPSDVALGFETASVGVDLDRWTTDSAIGRQVDRGTLIGWVTKDRSPRIECRLTEEQIADISTRTQVRVCMTQSPSHVLTGRVVEIGTMPQPDESTTKNHPRSGELHSMIYQVRIMLDENHPTELYSNGSAEVVFIKPSQSLLKLAMDNWMRDSRMR
jgi:putative peptide zinc metalloprotease protein